MLDQNGCVAEGTGENLFVMRYRKVKTPTITNILGGVTRKTAIHIMKEDGLEVIETQFGRDAMYVADEVFLSGTAAEITPVREVDHRTVGTGSPGDITKRVQSIYLTGVRGEVGFMRDWITLF
jgi:branched-chain amino acid aminotransferase